MVIDEPYQCRSRSGGSGGPTLGFVLSGGGSRGAMQAGALVAALEAGLRPQVLVGSSVGALNAAFLAWRPDLARAHDLARRWRAMPGRPLFAPGRLARVGTLLRHRDRLESPERLRRVVRELEYDRIEAAAVPLVIAATDLDAGRPRWFTSGRLEPALLASTAVPGVLPPVVIDGVRYVDGAVADPTPIAAAATAGATRCVVFDLGAPTRCDTRRPHVVDIVLQALHVMGRQRTLAELACPPPGVEVVHVPLPCAEPIALGDFGRCAELVEIGYEQARTALRAHVVATP